MKAIDHALNSLRELIEICRVKCGPHDEVILPNGRTNHQALIDAVQCLEGSQAAADFEFADSADASDEFLQQPAEDDLPGQFLASVARSMARNREGGAK